MTNEEIVILLQHGEGDRQQLLETLWMQNIRLIRRIVHKATGLMYDDPDFEDYEHQAFFGVLDAIHKYNPDNGKFFTYAAIYIHRSVFRYYDRADQGLRIPEDVRRKIRAYYREKDHKRARYESEEFSDYLKGCTDVGTTKAGQLPEFGR